VGDRRGNTVAHGLSRMSTPGEAGSDWWVWATCVGGGACGRGDLSGHSLFAD
jgi:hypothetical protein